MLAKQLGETIKNRRKELSITQPHLAELAKVSTNTLYKFERGQGNPSLDVLNKLAELPFSLFRIDSLPLVNLFMFHIFVVRLELT